MSAFRREFLVLSDSHGRRDLLLQLIGQLNFRPEAILFLGDGVRDLQVLAEHPRFSDIPIHAVAGNCDCFFDFTSAREPNCRLLPVGAHRIFMTHGHLYGVNGGVTAAAHNALAQGADVLLYGHTHIAAESYQTLHVRDEQGLYTEKTLLIANPGSIGEPRDGGGHRFGVLTLTEHEAIFSHGTLQEP
jgi:putative phosphoesterase